MYIFNLHIMYAYFLTYLKFTFFVCNKSFYRNVLQLYETNAFDKFEGSFDHNSIMFNVN